MTIEELKSKVCEYMLLADPSIIKFLAAVCMANRIDCLTPTWVFLVGASSGGKSTLLEPFSSLPNSTFLDNLTGKTLFSGMKSHEVETSLVNSITRNSMVLITDFTLMLDKDEKEVQQIMSQFRLIYDGKFNNYSGNGKKEHWTGRFGIIAGVTTAVYEKQQQYAALGERMVYYYFEQPDRKLATRMALKNINKTEQIKKEIGLAFKEYIEQTPIPTSTFPIDEQITNDLIDLSEMSTSARSSVSRKKFHRDNPITQINSLEMPMRMAKQLLNIAQGLMALNPDHTLNDEDKKILFKTAIDSIPKTRKDVMVKLTLFHRADVAGVAAELGLPYDTTKVHLEDLSALGVVSQHKAGNTKFQYELKPEYRSLIAKFTNIEMSDNVLEVKADIPLPEPPLTDIEQQAINVFN